MSDKRLIPPGMRACTWDEAERRSPNGEYRLGMIPGGIRGSNDSLNVIWLCGDEGANSVSGEMHRPSMIYRPSLSVDGNQWCALYGSNLQDGVAGFGDSPALAMDAFDAEWTRKLVEAKP